MPINITIVPSEYESASDSDNLREYPGGSTDRKGKENGKGTNHQKPFLESYLSSEDEDAGRGWRDEDDDTDDTATRTKPTFRRVRLFGSFPVGCG